MAHEGPEPGFEGVVRRLLPFTSVALIIAVLYLGWVFYSRWSERREYARRQADSAAERARQDFELNGGGTLKIMALNATPAVVSPGQAIQLCYSVANAKTVSFEPKIEDVWPSRSRCVEVRPRKDTTYVLTAKDDGGHTETAEVKVLVR